MQQIYNYFFKILTELIPKVCQDLLFLGKGIFR